MKLASILSTVAGLFGGPGMSTAIKLAATTINALKGGDPLPDDANQEQVIKAYETLEPGQQAAVDARMQLELGLEKEATAQLQALAQADGPGSSTRPAIATNMAWLLIFETLAFTAFLFTVLAREGVDGLAGLSALWVVFGILTSTPVAVILTYFNARGKEKRTRYAVAHGQSANLSGIGALISAFRK